MIVISLCRNLRVCWKPAYFIPSLCLLRKPAPLSLHCILRRYINFSLLLLLLLYGEQKTDKFSALLEKQASFQILFIVLPCSKIIVDTTSETWIRTLAIDAFIQQIQYFYSFWKGISVFFLYYNSDGMQWLCFGYKPNISVFDIAQNLSKTVSEIGLEPYLLTHLWTNFQFLKVFDKVFESSLMLFKLNNCWQCFWYVLDSFMDSYLLADERNIPKSVYYTRSRTSGIYSFMS